VTRSLCSRVLLLIVVLCAAGSACAQNFPVRPIRIVVPWPAGGPPDAVGRLIGSRIGEALKQQVVIDNRPGANSQTRAVNRVPACGM
jgi:tripartite-type tricarboxylate transporter receptor subunit TctC